MLDLSRISAPLPKAGDRPCQAESLQDGRNAKVSWGNATVSATCKRREMFAFRDFAGGEGRVCARRERILARAKPTEEPVLYHDGEFIFRMYANRQAA